VAEGIVLFAHGSRDPEWSRPFERVAGHLQASAPGTSVALAYLEHGTTLREAISSLASSRVKRIRVVPLFLGSGGHIKRDLPRLVDELRRDFPTLHIVLDEPIGERSEVIEAVAKAIAGR
jgi:sirohydrochlorin cobaltochelatase